MGAASRNGAVRAPAISEHPLTAVALVGDGGAIDRATALFLDCCGPADAFLAHFEEKISAVLMGETEQAEAKLDRTTLDITAVIDPEGERCALLTIARPADLVAGEAASPLLAGAISASPAIVWLKDLDGRYLDVNASYVEQLGVAVDHVRGKTDGELALGESIEGLRKRLDANAREPLELEYTVDAADGRPAFAVLRFAVRADNGKPTALCGIATALSRAELARSECAKLMRLERWSRSDEAQERAELLAEWGLMAAGAPDEPLVELPVADEPVGDGDIDQFAAMAVELDSALETAARLDQELAEERRQVMVLREASVLSSRRAQEMFRAVTAERSKIAQLEESLAKAEARATELSRERDSIQEELGRARTAASEAPTLEQLEAERAAAHEANLLAEQAQAELATASAALAKERRALEALRGELRAAEEETERARRAASEAVAQAPSQDELEQERRRADRAKAALASTRARAELAEAEAKSTLAQARAELRHTHEDAAATAEALNAEKQRVAALRGEIGDLRAELDRARRTAAERPGAEALEQERRRTEEAEAAAEQARAEAVELAARVAELERARERGSKAADQQASTKLLAELSAVQSELDHTAALLVAEQRTAAVLRQDLATARADLDRVAAAPEAVRAELNAVRKQLNAARAELKQLRAEGELSASPASPASPESGASPAPPVSPASPAPVVGGEASAANGTNGAGPTWGPAPQRALSAALTEVADWRATLKHAVKIIGSEGNWDVALAWCPEPRRSLLKCVGVWQTETEGSHLFETRAWQHRQKPPAQVPGAPTALVALDASEDGLLKAAAARGMASAVLLPISAGTQLLGMIQLLSAQPGPAAPELLLALEAVSLQLASVAGLINSSGTPHWHLGRL